MKASCYFPWETREFTFENLNGCLFLEWRKTPMGRENYAVRISIEVLQEFCKKAQAKGEDTVSLPIEREGKIGYITVNRLELERVLAELPKLKDPLTA